MSARAKPKVKDFYLDPIGWEGYYLPFSLGTPFFPAPCPIERRLFAALETAFGLERPATFYTRLCGLNSGFAHPSKLMHKSAQLGNSTPLATPSKICFYCAKPHTVPLADFNGVPSINTGVYDLLAIPPEDLASDPQQLFVALLQLKLRALQRRLSSDVAMSMLRGYQPLKYKTSQDAAKPQAGTVG
jgi:hypothetical protein